MIKQYTILQCHFTLNGFSNSSRAMVLVKHDGIKLHTLTQCGT